MKFTVKESPSNTPSNILNTYFSGHHELFKLHVTEKNVCLYPNSCSFDTDVLSFYEALEHAVKFLKSIDRWPGEKSVEVDDTVLTRSDVGDILVEFIKENTSLFTDIIDEYLCNRNIIN